MFPTADLSRLLFLGPRRWTGLPEDAFCPSEIQSFRICSSFHDLFPRGWETITLIKDMRVSDKAELTRCWMLQSNIYTRPIHSGTKASAEGSSCCSDRSREQNVEDSQGLGREKFSEGPKASIGGGIQCLICEEELSTVLTVTAYSSVSQSAPQGHADSPSFYSLPAACQHFCSLSVLKRAKNMDGLWVPAVHIGKHWCRAI